MNQNEYSFHGSDQSVSWESVRMVQQRVPYCDEIACPICLCDFVSARISKCGHSFCLPCILRHAQTYAANNPYHPVKCPCCGIPLVVEDTRPVVFDAVHPVVVQQSFRLRKLHRQKVSSSPFLPVVGEPRHSNPHFAPTAGIDADAKYSRFNYLDPAAYHASLVSNQGELELEMKETVGAGLGDVSTEKTYLSLALGMVLAEQQKAHQELEEEQSLMARFAGSNSGMYQPQSPALIFEEEGEDHLVDGCSSLTSVSLHEIDDSAVANNTNNDNDNGDSLSSVRRYRGDSICSYKSVDTASTPCSNQAKDKDDTASHKILAKKKLRKKIQGSMYLDTENAVHLYQAEDGQLVFLNGFNMTCLLSDFSKSPPSIVESSDGNCDPKIQGTIQEKSSKHVVAAPLPDYIEGRVLEKEHVHLTSETRKRMPFLNHVPLYTDIVFVELDLSHVLSKATRRKFKNDSDKRRKKRQSKVQAEKRADRIARKEDRERINERKARLQVVDPDDDFFRAAVAASEASSEQHQHQPESTTIDTSDFGPLVAVGGEGSETDGIHDAATGANNPNPRPSLSSSSFFSFSQAAQRGSAAAVAASEAFPQLSSSRAFPTLGSSSSPALAPRGGSTTTTWGSGLSSIQSGKATGTPSGGKKKKKKGQKLVLFSTGGSRGY